jgi:hypothetical protein
VQAADSPPGTTNPITARRTAKGYQEAVSLG